MTDDRTVIENYRDAIIPEKKKIADKHKKQSDHRCQLFAEFVCYAGKFDLKRYFDLPENEKLAFLERWRSQQRIR